MIWESRQLKLLEYTRLDGRSNMDLDRALLAACEAAPEFGFLRFYTWVAPALSMGRLEPEDAVDRTAAQRDGITIVRRPTGGRTVLHGDDLTYTVVVPRPEDAGLQETYNRLSEILVEGLSAIGASLDIERGKTGRSRMVQKPCFASVSRYEVTHKGRKLVGSAQRIGERAVLQHGSIPLGRGYIDVVDYMNAPPAARERLRDEMRACTSCLEEVLGKHIEARQVADALAAAFRRVFRCDLEPLAAENVDALMPAEGEARVGGTHIPNPGYKSP